MPGPYPAGANVFALLYGVPTWGFAMAWLVIAAFITLRAIRKGMPFALTWWSFTFPVGTCVTGTIALASRTDLDMFRYAAAGLFLLLLAAWLIVAVRTLHGSLRGRLFLPAPRRGRCQPLLSRSQCQPLLSRSRCQPPPGRSRPSPSSPASRATLSDTT